MYKWWLNFWNFKFWFCIYLHIIIQVFFYKNVVIIIRVPTINLRSTGTSHSAHVATSTELHGVKILISKFYVDSKNVSEKFLHRHYPVLKNHLYPTKGWFFLRAVTVLELSPYIFGIYIKFRCKNPSILTPCDSVDIGWVTIAGATMLLASSVRMLAFIKMKYSRPPDLSIILKYKPSNCLDYMARNRPQLFNFS